MIQLKINLIFQNQSLKKDVYQDKKSSSIMKTFFLIVLFFVACTMVNAQNPKGFDKMCNRYVKGTIDTVSAQSLKKALNQKSIILLDSREQKEYKTSHIKGAKWVGFDKLDLSSLKKTDKSSPVYVYCSIGYRSEKVGEKLKKMGFTEVYNVYGGIFSWVNSGFPVINSTGEKVKEVHGYNKNWSQWLNKDTCQPIVK